MHPHHCQESEELLIDLVHDLRQPLANLETSIYFLSKLVPDAPPQALEHIRFIERQVELAALRLSEAAADVRRLRAQRAAESLEFTNSATAAVT